jgi:hypothetical protein
MLKFLILFIATVSFSQDLEHLAKQDTVYIVLKNIDKNFSKQYMGFKYRSTVHTIFAEYQIIEPNGKQIIIHAPKAYQLFSVKRKEFFKKNKNNIINLKYIEKTGVVKVFIETFKLINPSRKIFYVFDERDLKKTHMKLKKVDVVAAVYSKI